MSTKPYQGIRIVLAEPNLGLRKEYLAVFKSLGCTDIVETGNINDVHAAIDKGGVDLLIGDMNLPEGDLSSLIHRIRHNVIGDNPFLIAMALVEKSDKDRVLRAIDSGADDVLLKPLDVAQLRRRLLKFTRGRKLFVVTSDYIGPDRQPGSRNRKNMIPRISAPNPLQLRLSRSKGSGLMRRSVAETMNEVNEQKVERQAYSVHWLMDRLMELKNGEISAAELNMEEQFRRLNGIAGDMSNRLSGTAYHHAAEMCLTLERMTHLLKESPELAGEEEISLLGKLTKVIKLKCNGNSPDEETPPVAAAAVDGGQMAMAAAG